MGIVAVSAGLQKFGAAPGTRAGDGGGRWGAPAVTASNASPAASLATCAADRPQEPRVIGIHGEEGQVVCSVPSSASALVLGAPPVSGLLWAQAAGCALASVNFSLPLVFWGKLRTR